MPILDRVFLCLLPAFVQLLIDNCSLIIDFKLAHLWQRLPILTPKTPDSCAKILELIKSNIKKICFNLASFFRLFQNCKMLLKTKVKKNSRVEYPLLTVSYLLASYEYIKPIQSISGVKKYACRE